MSNPFQNLPHPRALAFLGDAVFEIFLRESAVAHGFSKSKDLHAYTTSKAKASAQVTLMNALKPHLTEAEQEVIRQGRNVGVSSSRRSEQVAHRLATGFEALLGALYLTDTERLHALLALSKQLLATLPMETDNLPSEEPEQAID